MNTSMALKIGGIALIGFVCFKTLGLLGLLLVAGVAMVIFS